MINRLSLLTSSGLLSGTTTTEGLFLKDCCNSKKKGCCGSKEDEKPKENIKNADDPVESSVPDNENEDLSYLVEKEDMQQYLETGILKDVPRDAYMKRNNILVEFHKKHEKQVGVNARAYLNSLLAENLLIVNGMGYDEAQENSRSGAFGFLELNNKEEKENVSAYLNSGVRALLDIGTRRGIQTAIDRCPGQNGKTLGKCLKHVIENSKESFKEYVEGDDFCQYAAAAGGDSYDLKDTPKFLTELYEKIKGETEELKAADGSRKCLWLSGAECNVEEEPTIIEAVYGLTSCKTGDETGKSEFTMGNYEALTTEQKENLIAGLTIKTENFESPQELQVKAFKSGEAYKTMAIAAFKQCIDRQKPEEEKEKFCKDELFIAAFKQCIDRQKPEEEKEKFCKDEKNRKTDEIEEDCKERLWLDHGHCGNEVLPALLHDNAMADMKSEKFYEQGVSMLEGLASVDGKAMADHLKRLDMETTVNFSVMTAAVKNTHKALKNVKDFPDLKKNSQLENLLKEAVKAHGEALEDALPITKAADTSFGMSTNPEGKKALDEKKDSLLKELALLGVGNYGLGLQYVEPKDFLPKEERFAAYEEICLAAVGQDGKAIQYVFAKESTDSTVPNVVNDIKEALKETDDYKTALKKAQNTKAQTKDDQACNNVLNKFFSKCAIEAMKQDPQAAEKLDQTIIVAGVKLSKEAEQKKDEAAEVLAKEGKATSAHVVNNNQLQEYGINALLNVKEYEQVRKTCENVNGQFDSRLGKLDENINAARDNQNKNRVYKLEGEKIDLKESKDSVMKAMTTAAFEAGHRIMQSKMEEKIEKVDEEAQEGKAKELKREKTTEVHNEYKNGMKPVYGLLKGGCEMEVGNFQTGDKINKALSAACYHLLEGVKKVEADCKENFSAGEWMEGNMLSFYNGVNKINPKGWRSGVSSKNKAAPKEEAE